MSRIRILPEEISNRIAAGEVIERPASVVKEFVENAIDAGASRITIQVERGGRSLIRVVDDGCGMDAEDALLCLEAHATSKIRESLDIDNICTLGFRGEALPSIASVARFSLRTRPHDADEGTEVVVDGGVIKNVGAVGCAPGTSVTVRSIFYNMPARRKFLRSINTEEAHIQEMTLLLALGHPELGIELSFDRRTVITVQPGSDPRTRATMLLGRQTMAAMLEIDYEEDGVRVTGFAARPGLTRSARREQRTFVNGRPIEADVLYHAIRDAYHTLVMKGRYPPVLLFIELAADRIDVNVHPAKRELRFRDRRSVGRVVSAAMRRALRGLTQSAAPNAAVPPPPEIPLPALDFSASPPTTTAPAPSMPPAAETVPSQGAPATAAPPDKAEAAPGPGPAEAPAPAKTTSVSAADPGDIKRLRVIGEIANLYLLAEGPSGLVLIDQHAAHERILFERIMRQAKDKDGLGQGLLIPVTLEFGATDADVLRRHLKELRWLGFRIEDFGGNTVIVEAIPPEFPRENIGGVLHDVVDQLRDSPFGAKRLDEAEIAQAACKAAVKAKDHLTDTEVAHLLRDLARTALPYTCPHGRPTMINLSYAELEKRFGRRH